MDKLKDAWNYRWKYEYKPIYTRSDNEIRLLHLLPSRCGQKLQGSLKIVSLLDRPPISYETVSYCWGNAHRTHTIWIDGLPLAITKNAYNALHALRQRKTTRILWLDGICINQKHGQEKEGQVKLMGDIYRRTTRTLAWLGDVDDETARSAVVAARHIARTFRLQWQHHLRTIDQSSYEADRIRFMDNGMYGTRFLPPDFDSIIGKQENLYPLLRCDWFSRLWVVQEACLAPQTVCYYGGQKLNWTDIVQSAAFLYSSLTVPEDIKNTRLVGLVSIWTILPSIDASQHVSKRRESPIEFKNLIDLSTFFQSSLPHDRVFAMLGLAGWSPFGRRKPPANITISYSISPGSLFCHATKYAIVDSQNLSVLNYRSIYEKRGDDDKYSTRRASFPSWALPLDAASGQADVASLPWSTYTMALENGVYSVEGPTRILNLTGFILSVVDVLGEVFNIATSFKSICSAYDYIRNFMTKRMISCLSKDIAHDCTFDTAVASALDDQRVHFHPDYHEAKAKFADIWAKNRFDGRNIAGHFAPGFQAPDSTFLRSMRDACDDRRIFYTSRSLVGLGPRDMQVGDIICMLFGGVTPYVLRPHGPDYYFVGECYVHGFMHGEFASFQEEKQLRQQVFSIH